MTSSCDLQIPFPDHISHPIDDSIIEILAITTINGRLIHYVQLEGGKKTMIPSTLTNVLVPQLVIEFYQKRMFFVNVYNQKMRPAKNKRKQRARKSTQQRSQFLPPNKVNASVQPSAKQLQDTPQSKPKSQSRPLSQLQPSSKPPTQPQTKPLPLPQPLQKPQPQPQPKSLPQALPAIRSQVNLSEESSEE